MLAYLQKGREKDSGWLQKEESDANNELIEDWKSRVHSKEREKDLLVKIRACIVPLITLKKPSHSFSPTKDLAYAFGVSVSIAKQ